MKTFYKVVGPNGEPLHGGSGSWSLPTATEPGDWREVPLPIVACQNGLHVADAVSVWRWLPARGIAFAVYRVEVDGQVIDAGEKYVVARARLLPLAHPVKRARSWSPEYAARRRAAAIARADRAYDRAVKSIPAGWLRLAEGAETWHRATGGYLAVLRDAVKARKAAYDAANAEYGKRIHADYAAIVEAAG